jgi:hypothetical protein
MNVIVKVTGACAFIGIYAMMVHQQAWGSNHTTRDVFQKRSGDPGIAVTMCILTPATIIQSHKARSGVVWRQETFVRKTIQSLITYSHLSGNNH